MIRTKKERGRFIVMCSGMNGTCPNPAHVFDFVRIAYYCRKCLEHLRAMPKSWPPGAVSEAKASIELDGNTYCAGDSEENDHA